VVVVVVVSRGVLIKIKLFSMEYDIMAAGKQHHHDSPRTFVSPSAA
jgi:hypothetical protein